MEPLGQLISFGPFRLDGAGGRLLRGGKLVALRFKTFAVLEYLARRPGRLVGKDELFDALWPDVVVTPSELTELARRFALAVADAVARAEQKRAAPRSPRLPSARHAARRSRLRSSS